MLIKALNEVPVIGILRDIPFGAEEDCALVCKRAGLRAIEVTMNTSNVLEIIERLSLAAAPLRIFVGAGTVRSLEDLEKAISVGAQFIVTPITSVEVIEECVRNHVPVIPGALTPTEIQLAYELGASFVKVFPVNAMGGPSYIKDLRGPFKDIPLMACGGVNESNASEYRAAGANLLAFGASIFDPEQMRSHQWEAIEKKLKAFLSSI